MDNNVNTINIVVNLDDIKNCPLLTNKKSPHFDDEFMTNHLNYFNDNVCIMADEDILNAETKDICKQSYVFTKEIKTSKNTKDAPKHATSDSMDVLDSPLVDAVPQNNDQQYDIENVVITVSSDKLQAYITLSLPANGVFDLTPEDLRTVCKENQIIYNLNDEFMTRLCRHPIYDEPFIIAQGKKPILGQKGYIQYYFDLAKKTTATIDEHDYMDFKHLQVANLAVKNQKLCSLIPPEPSIDGINVYGDVILTPKLFEATLKLGNNVFFDENGLDVFAACDGRINYLNPKISISSELTVYNVNNSTGNITYNGNVNVTGDVYSGFSITAAGNICVKGSVEAATLVAGNDIYISKGMNGNKVGSVECGGNFVSKFIEHSTITANGDIVADAVFNCDIASKSWIRLAGEHCRIIGGNTTAARGIQAKVIGNEGNVLTKISINNVATLRKELFDLNATISLHRDMLMQISNLFVSMCEASTGLPVVKTSLMYLLYLHITVERKIEELITRSNSINENMFLRTASIDVSGKLFPNVSIDINGATCKTSTHTNTCSVTISDKEIVFLPLH